MLIVLGNVLERLSSLVIHLTHSLLEFLLGLQYFLGVRLRPERQRFLSVDLLEDLSAYKLPLHLV